MTAPATDLNFPEQPEFALEEEPDSDFKGALIALYGPDCPLVSDEPTEEQWVQFAKSLWDSRRDYHDAVVHRALKYREMRDGNQWISSRAQGKWREPRKAKDQTRAVWNMLSPALDLHDQVVVEQRPGFRTRPTRLQDPRSVRRAEAQQVALEYQFDQQNMEGVISDMRWWAGTDGICFCLQYWDPSAGPWHEAVTPHIGPEGRQERKHAFPLGDPRPRVYPIEHVRVASDGTRRKRPSWCVIREVLPLAQAVAEHGPRVVKDEDRQQSSQPSIEDRYNAHLRGALRDEDRFDESETVDRFIVLLEPNDFLPGGLSFIVVGDLVVAEPTDLETGVAPYWWLRDGSRDPAFYPKPRVQDWEDLQVQINASVSRWIDSLRAPGGSLAMRADAVEQQTLIAGLREIVRITAPGPIGDNIQVLPHVSVANDTILFLQTAIQQFEKVSGWNDTSRGSFSSAISGRAILAIREQLERIFAPSVIAAANGMQEWARITLHFLRWGYELPRVVALFGQQRPDLARELTADDFDGVSDVEVDAESLMPMPKAYRLMILDRLLEIGVITPEEYRRRLPFANVMNLDTPDTDHHARARRVCEGFRRVAEGVMTLEQVPTLEWQDDVRIHQDALERELILNDDEHPMARQLARMRWNDLAMLASYQQMAMAGAMGGGLPGGGGAATPMDPRTQPLLSMNPSVSAGPANQMIGGDEQNAAMYDNYTGQ